MNEKLLKDFPVCCVPIYCDDEVSPRFPTLFVFEHKLALLTIFILSTMSKKQIQLPHSVNELLISLQENYCLAKIRDRMSAHSCYKSCGVFKMPTLIPKLLLGPLCR